MVSKDPAPYRVTGGHSSAHPERAARASAKMLPGFDRIGVTYVYDPRPEYDRLEELRAVIRSESISYGEIAELQGLARFIHPSDTELLEWAGVPENKEE